MKKYVFYGPMREGVLEAMFAFNQRGGFLVKMSEAEHISWAKVPSRAELGILIL